MGNPLLRRSQIAPEAIVGTPPASSANRQLSGALAMHNAPERTRREEYRAVFTGSNTYDDLSYRSEGTYRGRCTTRELPFFLAASIDGSVAPSANVWTYNQPLTSIPSLKSHTLYVGDNTQALRSAACYVPRWAIEGRNTAAWTFEADILGREQVSSGATFATRDTEPNTSLKNLLGGVYITDTGASLAGAAIQPQTFYGFRFEYRSGIVPDYTMDGQLDMKDIVRGEPSATLELTGKWNAIAVNEFTKFRTMASRYIALQNANATAPDTVRIEGAFIITEFEPLAEERDGVTICRMRLAMVHDPSWGSAPGKALSVVVTSSLTAADLPVA